MGNMQTGRSFSSGWLRTLSRAAKSRCSFSSSSNVMIVTGWPFKDMIWNHSYWTLTQFQGHSCPFKGSERGFEREKFLFLTKTQKALVMVWSDIIDEVTTVDKMRIKDLLVHEKEFGSLLQISEIKLKLHIWGLSRLKPFSWPHRNYTSLRIWLVWTEGLKVIKGEKGK